MRRNLIGLFILLSFIGYHLKYYRGPGQNFINNYGPASVVYEILWIIIFAFIFLDKKYLKTIAISVCVSTCFLEFLQLWQAAWLIKIRSTTFGGLVLGSTFSWADFPAYFIGSYLGYLILTKLFEGLAGRL